MMLVYWCQARNIQNDIYILTTTFMITPPSYGQYNDILIVSERSLKLTRECTLYIHKRTITNKKHTRQHHGKIVGHVVNYMYINTPERDLVRFGQKHFDTNSQTESGSHELHYNDVIMTTMASQITSLAVVYSTVYSGWDQRKHQSFA